MFLLFQSFKRLADSDELFTLLLVMLSFLQVMFTLGGQDGALDVTERADDLALELFEFGFQVGLVV